MNSSGKGAIQDLLYLQCNSTSIASKAIGMAIVENGVLSDGPANTEDWPYKTVLEAINAGWRVIQFPVIVAGSASRGLQYVPCEFILERSSKDKGEKP